MHLGVIFTLLLQLALILAVSRAMGWLFRYLRQPQVMGEMLAGIFLGPSLLGWLWPEASAWIFPSHTVASLNVLSQVGVIFFLFLIGLELDPKLLRNRGHTAVVVSHVSIVAPFLLGAALALYLYPRLFNDAPRMKFASVALFMGAAMSITAFPVLARILTERNLHKTNIGAITITCAAVDDVTAWCMLAFVIGVARADGLMPAVMTASLSVCYVAGMLLLARPFLGRLQGIYDRHGRVTQGLVAGVMLLVLLSALATEAIGIHALFGAFLLGAIMPKGTKFVRALSERLEDYTVVFLLPIFFAFTGLRTQIGLIDRPELWIDTALIVLVACAGKFGGSTVAGRVCGLSWSEASTVGILMNTRGLMELVILNIGLQEGVITPVAFAMMVIMALVTTAMTTPILHVLFPSRLPAGAAAEDRKGMLVLIPVSLPQSGVSLARLATAIIGSAPNAGRVLALHLRQPAEHEAYRSGLDEDSDANLAALTPLLAEANKQKLRVEPISFVTSDVSSDIAAVANARNVNLVLMGFHKPVFTKAILGGVVHGVMREVQSDVAILVDRGLTTPSRILVPYMGSPDDRLALDLAGRIACSCNSAVTVLHIVDPAEDRTPTGAKATVTEAFRDASLPKPLEFRVEAHDSPIDLLVREARQFDLVVVGMTEEWGLESRFMGLRPERVAAEVASSLLIVNRGQRNLALATTTSTPRVPGPIAGA